MAVNPNSVIPVWINSYFPAAYVALTNQEDWSYQNATGGFSFWWQQFQLLAAAMTGYQGFNRRSEIQTFMEGTYGYIANGALYGTDQSLRPQFDAYARYSMAGFLNAAVTRPVNYYNDYTVDPLDPMAVPYSPRMQADVATVNGSIAVETAAMSSVPEQTHAALHDIIYTLMFQDVPTQGVVNKQTMATTFFVDLRWNAVFNNLNVGGLPKPPGV